MQSQAQMDTGVRRKLLLVLAALMVNFTCTWSQTRSQQPCNSQELNDDCEKCLSYSSECVWCPTPQSQNTMMSSTYCRSRSSVSPCATDVIGLPQAQIQIITQEEINSAEFTYVTPQNVNIRLRKGESTSFDMRFRLFSDMPTDVYFLFDASATMSRILNTLKDNILSVESAIRGLSSSFHLGMGSFQDKPTMPYATTNNLRYVDPDDLSLGTECLPGFTENTCNPTYSYQHLLSLSDSVLELQNAMNSTTISTNLDSIEGGLEALVQVAMCGNVIGWRPNALHILLVFTDNGYHIAGDGRLAGLVTPNDGECHLMPLGNSDTHYEYTHSLKQDYPSVKQVNDILNDAGISPVFMIRTLDESVERFLPPYTALAEELRAVRARAINYSRNTERNVSTFVNILDSISTDLLQSIYISPPEVDGFTFQIEPTSGCNRRDALGACLLDFGDEVHFNVTVTLNDCKPAARNQSIQLSSLPYLFTSIQLEALCECSSSTNSH